MGRNLGRLRRSALLWISLLALLGARGAVARDDSPDSALRNLTDKMWLVTSLARDYPASAFWRTWQGLFDDVEMAGARFSGESGFVDLRQKMLLGWGLTLEERRDDPAAEEKYRLLLDAPDDIRVAASSGLGRILERRATATADGEAKVGMLRQAEEFFLAGRDREASIRARTARVGIQAKAGLDLYRAKQYGRALALLDELAGEEGGELPPGDAADALRDLRTQTGELTLEKIPVPIAGTPVVGSGRIVLTPQGSGERYEGGAEDTLRWRSGSYRFQLFVGGVGDAVVTSDIRIAADRPASAQVPEKVPDGMVFVPASPANRVARPFFIDRTEVTVAAFRKFDSSYRPQYEGDSFPAHGIEYEAARRFASSVGKELPSEDQWLWAAFAGSSGKLPWPGTETRGRANLGAGSPSAVGTYPAGVFGIQDMVGNVWEWLSDGYAIGAGFRAPLDAYERQSLDPLRQKKPGESTYGAMSPTDKDRYTGYRVVSKDSRQNLQEVGLRCVRSL